MTAKKRRAARVSAPPSVKDLRQDLTQGEVDLDDGVVVTISELDGVGRVAGFRPVAFDRMSPHQREIAGDMIKVIGMQRHAVAHLDELVAEAREIGMSWASIGWCVGISGQAAGKRWGGESPTT